MAAVKRLERAALVFKKGDIVTDSDEQNYYLITQVVSRVTPLFGGVNLCTGNTFQGSSLENFFQVTYAIQLENRS